MKKNIDDVDACFKKILKLSEVRERCMHELENRLVVREGFSRKAFMRASSRAQEYGIIDDLRYAEFYIRTCENSNKGIYGVLKHLDFNKIKYQDNNFLLQLIEESKSSEVERAYNYICRRKSSSKNLFKSYMSRLIRRGFSADVAYQAVSKLLNNNDSNI